MKPRTLIIILIVLIAVLGVIFYFLTRQSATTAPQGQTGSLPSVGNQQLPATSGSGQGGQNGTTTESGTTGLSSSTTFGIVSTDPALDYYVDSQNNTTVIQPNGTIETITAGKATMLSSSPIQDIVSASFSYDGKKILVVFGNSPTQASIFDVTTKAWSPVNEAMQSPAWSPAGYQIAYLAPAANGRENILVRNASSSGSAATTLTTIAMEDMTLSWVNKDTLLLADKPSAFTTGSAWFFSITNKTLNPVAFEYPGLVSLWSNTTNTQGIVFSGNNGSQGGHLNFVNTTGNKQLLSFVTLPSKCAFNVNFATTTQTVATTTLMAPSASSTSKKKILVATTTQQIVTTSSLALYCAVPRDKQTFSIARLPDEYEQKILFTADDFYKMDAASGTLTTVFSDQSQTLDAVDLKVFNNTLFFVNRYDQKLYAISLASETNP